MRIYLFAVALIFASSQYSAAQELHFNGRTSVTADSIVFFTDGKAIIYAPKSREAAPHEIGLTISGFFDYGFLYKKHLREQRYLTLRTLAFLATASDEGGERIRLTVAGGFEKRRPLAEKLWLVHGPQLYLRLEYNNDVAIQLSAGVGPGYLLGAQYHLTELFYLQFQVSASVQANYAYIGPHSRLPARDYWSVSAGVSNANAGLSLVYRIF